MASILNIDDVDDNVTDIQSFLRTIDDSTSTIKGHFRVSNRINSDDFAIFTISSVTENTGYFSVNSSYVSGSATSFINSEDVIITFARTGDKGDTGAQGLQGVQGAQGEQSIAELHLLHAHQHIQPLPLGRAVNGGLVGEGVIALIFNYT